MYRISPFTPLFFHPSRDISGRAGRCVQLFSRSDSLLVEVLTDVPGSVSVTLSAEGWAEPVPLTPGIWQMNAGTALAWCVLRGLDAGVYTLTAGTPEDGYVESEPFVVTDEAALLEGTTLLQYSGQDNRGRDDVVFRIGGMRRFFAFRAPGGFKDDGWGFGVDNEQFTTAAGDVLDVHSRESETRVFTMGSGYGAPVWFGALLNRILSCPYVYFDGVRYTRQEGSVPELNQTVEGQRSFIFKQAVQRVWRSSPVLADGEAVVLRRLPAAVGRGDFRKVNDKARKIWI